MDVRVHFPQGSCKLNHDESLEIGRGKYGITDMQVSRVHLQITFSKTAESVVVKSLSKTNPSFLWRKGENIKITLRTDEKEILEDGDRVSLLADNYFLQISIKNDVGRKRKRPLERSETIVVDNNQPLKLKETPSFEKPKTKKQKRM